MLQSLSGRPRPRFEKATQRVINELLDGSRHLNKMEGKKIVENNNKNK